MSHSIIEDNGGYVCTDCGNVFGELYGPNIDNNEPIQEISMFKEYIKHILDDFELPAYLLYSVIELYNKVSRKYMDKKCIIICLQQTALEQCKRTIDLQEMLHRYGISNKNINKIKNTTNNVLQIEDKFTSHFKYISNVIDMNKKDTQICLKYISFVKEIMRTPKIIAIGLIVYLSKLQIITIDIDYKHISKKAKCSMNTIKACYEDIKNTLKDINL